MFALDIMYFKIIDIDLNKPLYIKRIRLFIYYNLLCKDCKKHIPYLNIYTQQYMLYYGQVPLGKLTAKLQSGRVPVPTKVPTR